MLTILSIYGLDENTINPAINLLKDFNQVSPEKNLLNMIHIFLNNQCKNQTLIIIFDQFFLKFPLLFRWLIFGWEHQVPELGMPPFYLPNLELLPPILYWIENPIIIVKIISDKWLYNDNV